MVPFLSCDVIVEVNGRVGRYPPDLAVKVL
jgi:hypothetical protein